MTTRKNLQTSYKVQKDFTSPIVLALPKMFHESDRPPSLDDCSISSEKDKQVHLNDMKMKTRR